MAHFFFKKEAGFGSFKKTYLGKQRQDENRLPLTVSIYLPVYLLPRPIVTYLHLLSPTYTNLHLPTPTYTYLHLPTPIYTYLHLITPTYTYLHLP